jgi:hypothetical protein
VERGRGKEGKKILELAACRMQLLAAPENDL